MASLEKPIRIPIDFAAFFFGKKALEGASDEARFGKENEAPIPIGRPNDLSFWKGNRSAKPMPFPILKQWLELGF